MNRNVKILSRRLYSPDLKDEAWLERVQLFFFQFSIHNTYYIIFLCRVNGAAREKSYRQMHENPAKLTERLISDQHARD